MRADIPLGVELLPVFWKNLVNITLDPITDLQDADVLTYNYIKKVELVRYFQALLKAPLKCQKQRAMSSCSCIHLEVSHDNPSLSYLFLLPMLSTLWNLNGRDTKLNEDHIYWADANCLQAESEQELQELTSGSMPTFVYTTLNGEEVELIPNGHHVPVK